MTPLRYTGQQPTSFMAYPYLGEVAPGEFEARDEDAEVLLLRADVERVGADSAPGPQPKPGVEQEQSAPPKTRKTSISKPSGIDQSAGASVPPGE